MILATAVRSKVLAIAVGAAVVGGGGVASFFAVRHHNEVSAVASIPMPSAPVAANGGMTPTMAPGAAPGAAPGYPQGYAAGPVAVPTAPPVGYGPTAVPTAQVVAQVTLLNEQQLDQLLAPVALYPDPLLGEMLPASTYPDQLAAASFFVQTHGEGGVDGQPWEPSVRGVAHSPSVLMWMAGNPDWTRTLGTAFAYQPQDVMNSIQRLRGAAVAAGCLVDTPQQVVVYESGLICIEPATVDVIYVPVYDWRVVYARGGRRDAITFFAGCPVGDWLDFDCDWGGRTVVLGAQWNRGWDHRWDHDGSARPVAVKSSTTVVNNTTIVNNNNAGQTREVKVGGTPWKRNEVQPAPSLPAAVAPAGRSIERGGGGGPPVEPGRGVPSGRSGERPVEPLVVPGGSRAVPLPASPPDRGASGGQDRGVGQDRGGGGGQDRGRGRGN